MIVQEEKIRILVAKPGIDIHDRGALVLTQAFRDAGIEAIYTGLYQSPDMIVSAAIQEDVNGIAVSLLDGQPLYVFKEIMKELKKKEAEGIFVLGGGCIEDRFKPRLKEMGITEIFGSKTPLKEIVDHVIDMAKDKG
jgi:methylmalonyl-CoA mutase C-terminal domain/subunit